MNKDVYFHYLFPKLGEDLINLAKVNSYYYNLVREWSTFYLQRVLKKDSIPKLMDIVNSLLNSNDESNGINKLFIILTGEGTATKSRVTLVEILKQAIIKASKGGYKLSQHPFHIVNYKYCGMVNDVYDPYRLRTFPNESLFVSLNANAIMKLEENIKTVVFADLLREWIAYLSKSVSSLAVLTLSQSELNSLDENEFYSNEAVQILEVSQFLDQAVDPELAFSLIQL